MCGDLIQAGKMRALAVTGTKRMTQLPDVPTFAEAGLPDFTYDTRFGVLMPAAIPNSIVSKVGEDIAEIVEASEMKARFEAQGVNLMSSTPQAFDSILHSDAARFGKLYQSVQAN
jgi:tripartite-type tricarboxylate transporter receptor subunit TctC